MTKRLYSTIALACLGFSCFAQQIDINRIEQFPKAKMTPYLSRDWKQVSKNYDHLVFDLQQSGPYLPLSSVKGTGYNFPDISPIYLDTYVGSSHQGEQAEAINILPAVVGASLVGIDKSASNGIDWVSKTKEFFNEKNGEYVYLNNYASNSGHDWWYETMPNVFFYQLYDLYPEDQSKFSTQFTDIADQWCSAVSALGGKYLPQYKIPDMDYRAYNLKTKQPLHTGVKEPESAGAIAWILYNAYHQTHQSKYKNDAMLAMDFLNQYKGNPSYEIQLPYGVYTAARMNAEEGTHYDIEKMVNWCFDRGPLRGWGCISGVWGDYNVSGLIGEANDGGDDYAFVMNGFQHAAALVPMVRYDKRFAKAIGKWVYHLAHASALFYPTIMKAQNNESASLAWSKSHDFSAAIPYESIKEQWGSQSPLAMGDAIKGGWAKTNLSLYSGSSVGYLAAVLSPSTVEGINILNLNKTDFFTDTKFESRLIYNPFGTEQSITVNVPQPGSFQVYDAISEKFIAKQVSGNMQINLQPDQVVLLTFVPSNETLKENGNHLLAGNQIVDYQYKGFPAETAKIITVAVDDPELVMGEQIKATAVVKHPEEGTTFHWQLGDLAATTDEPQWQFEVPRVHGLQHLQVKMMKAHTLLSQKDFSFSAQRKLITGIESKLESPVAVGTKGHFVAKVPEDFKGEVHWRIQGELSSHIGTEINIDMPKTAQVVKIEAIAKEGDQEATAEEQYLVKGLSTDTPKPVLYYSFNNGSVENLGNAGSSFQGEKHGLFAYVDPTGKPRQAFRFGSTDDFIKIPNGSPINFDQPFAVSFWIKPSAIKSEEQYIISHGDYSQRFKVSIIPGNILRFTIKTAKGISDLDSKQPLEKDQYQHVVVQYTGSAMEIYIDGKLNHYQPFSGALHSSSLPLIIGKSNEHADRYGLKAVLDEVKVFNQNLSLKAIKSLMSFDEKPLEASRPTMNIKMFPVPTSGELNIVAKDQIQRVTVFSLMGQKVFQTETALSHEVTVNLAHLSTGTYFVQVHLKNGTIISKSMMKV
ncbi:LamG-like jellyroll fold domain-containing protein [Persicobacter psychrovividus]|uniref:LamG-like jellyroll fold domain-containing protein n=1 Tax=Persicobacter psychrovividus TaxID=387638 RepID=A0ABN6LFV6_9BACT|nr:hypothetical protein PEPS_42520 [Persicobacter psychrovividus]